MPRRLLKPILCVAAALAVWASLPGTAIDRAFFSLTARPFANPPFFVTGDGTHGSAYTLRTLRRFTSDFPSELLTDITITDDPEKIFQESPPTPVDFSVILKNLRRLGRESVAIGMPLSWAEPDMISLIALDQQLDAFPAVVTSAPLSRSPITSPLPPAFRRASIPLSQVKGDTTGLPIVNRVSIPDVVLGNATSLAGFTILESEPESDQPYLLARWDERVVLSFQLLAVIDHYQLPPQSVEIRLGKYISLGMNGPFIPIDEYGRLSFPPPSPRPQDMRSIPAENLIVAPDDFLDDRPPGQVLIRNSMSSADEPSVRFSEALVPTVSLLADPSGTSTAQIFPRLPWYAELFWIASIVSMVHGLGNYPKLAGRLPLGGFAGLVLILHFILVPGAETWIPTFPSLAALLVAIPLTGQRRDYSRKAIPLIPKEEAAPARKEAKKAAKKTARKAAQKVAKKAAKKAARKTPAKKAPRKPKKG
jgi:hypothetical protein